MSAVAGQLLAAEKYGLGFSLEIMNDGVRKKAEILFSGEPANVTHDNGVF